MVLKLISIFLIEIKRSFMIFPLFLRFCFCICSVIFILNAYNRLRVFILKGCYTPINLSPYFSYLASPTPDTFSIASLSVGN